MILSFVPSGEQRIWRSMTRMKLPLTRDRVRLQNQIECLLEEMLDQAVDCRQHEGGRFIEQGNQPDAQAKKKRARILVQALRRLGDESQSPKHI